MPARPTPGANMGTWGDDLNAHLDVALDATSGAVKDAALGSGSASSSTFLRGDRSWQVPPSSGGGSAEMLQLTATASAGATGITVNSAGLAAVLPQSVLLIGVGTNQWDFKPVTSSGVSGNTIGLSSALDYTHASGQYVAVLSQANQPVPASWIGFTQTDSDSAASNNRAMFNRAMSHTGVGVAAGAFCLALDGYYYINDICLMRGNATRLTSLSGANTSGGLIARSGFPFTPTGTTQMLGIQDTSGGYSTYADGFDADTTCWIDSVFLDGRNLTDSVLLVVSPQQPGWIRDMRFLGATGVTSFAYANQNYCDLSNLQFGFCTAPLFGHLLSGCRGLNLTDPVAIAGVYKSVRIAAYSCMIENALVETTTAPGPLISIEAGTGITLKNIWTSGFGNDGAPGTGVNVDTVPESDPVSYNIEMLRFNQTEDTGGTLKVLRDVDRNFSLYRTDIPDRYLNANASGGNVNDLTTGTAYYKNSSGVWTSTAGAGVPHAA